MARPSPAESFSWALTSGVETAARYEDAGLQEEALSRVPLSLLADRTSARIERSQGALDDEDYADLLVREVMAWFKGDFFSWVDSPQCSACGEESTVRANPAVAAPTPAERAWGASRVECYHCTKCGALERFPRYNHPRALLETRKGRCGEWANCFALILRSLGREARWVRDWQDHVWTECWSDNLGRWVHCDACENAWDTPLLYSQGWKKKLSYVIAFGRTGVADVSRRYVGDWQAALLRRTLVGEPWLEAKVKTLSHSVLQMSGEHVSTWMTRNEKERAILASAPVKLRAAEDLPGRQSGSVQWRSERGEMQTELPRYELKTMTVRASGENPPDEMCYCLFDGSRESKWLDFSHKTEAPSWIEVASMGPRRLQCYELICGNDEPARDPMSWVVEGKSSRDSLEWSTLDTRQGVRFPSRHAPLLFHAESSPSDCTFSVFRFRFTTLKNPASANSIQLCGLHIFFAPYAGGEQTAKQAVERLKGLESCPQEAFLLAKTLHHFQATHSLETRGLSTEQVSSSSRVALAAIGWRAVDVTSLRSCGSLFLLLEPDLDVLQAALRFLRAALSNDQARRHVVASLVRSRFDSLLAQGGKCDPNQAAIKALAAATKEWEGIIGTM